MQRIRITYSKGKATNGNYLANAEMIKFIGHLDMVRLWERALRRTDLPVAYSAGFNPRQKLSFGPPLPLGIVSECEMIDIFFEKWITPENVKEELNKTLPPGIEIIEAKNIFSGMASITAQITTALYRIHATMDASNTIERILAADKIPAIRKDKEINIRPMIKGLKQENGNIFLEAQCNNNGALKLSEITSLFDGTGLISITRTTLY